MADNGFDHPSLVIVAPYFWPEPIGSAPYCTDLAGWLAVRGYNVEVITSRPHYPSQSRYSEWEYGRRDRDAHDGVLISRRPGGHDPGSGFVARIKNDVRFMWYVLDRSREARYRGADVVLCFVPSVLAIFPARVIAYLAKAPLIAIVHDIESGLAGALKIAHLKPIGWLMRAVERLAFSMCTRRIVLTNAMYQEMVRLGVSKSMEIVPIWTDVPTETVDRATKDSRGVTIMYSGNFGKKQNLDQLIPLFSGMADQCTDVRFILQGEGSEKARIERIVKRQGVNNVTFKDLVPAGELFESLGSADIHLVPQANDVAPYAIPSKVYSIMASKRPFIAIAETTSPLAGLAAESGGGVVVSPGDDSAMISVVRKLAGDRKLRAEMGDKGRRYVEENMLREHIFAKYEAIVGECILEARMGDSVSASGP